jgi:hypothetical protein
MAYACTLLVQASDINNRKNELGLVVHIGAVFERDDIAETFTEWLVSIPSGELLIIYREPSSACEETIVILRVRDSSLYATSPTDSDSFVIEFGEFSGVLSQA